MGGTQLTITGKGFGSADVSKVKVKVAGVECRIDEVTDTTIKCTTGDIDPLDLERDSFPGKFIHLARYFFMTYNHFYKQKGLKLKVRSQRAQVEP